VAKILPPTPTFSADDSAIHKRKPVLRLARDFWQPIRSSQRIISFGRYSHIFEEYLAQNAL